ncbi:MAG: hypothetical protein ACJZ91_00945 [Alphaproteobacteria bacterium]|jgi:hypothetical protein|tara:strand:- start:129 stop:581 length:453 start_codon:yes stop_codon:yes gene_type:complete
MFKNYLIIFTLIFLVSCSDSAYFDPGPCPRAAILKGSETKELDRSDLVVELNRTIMICEYNLRRKNINFDVGIFGDVINSDTATIENLRINLFIAFIGPDDIVIDKWSKIIPLKLKNQKITSFSIPIEGLRSKIEEGRTGSSYKVLIGLE